MRVGEVIGAPFIGIAPPPEPAWIPLCGEKVLFNVDYLMNGVPLRDVEGYIIDSTKQFSTYTFTIRLSAEEPFFGTRLLEVPLSWLKPLTTPPAVKATIGHNCTRCKERNDYAESNQKDGSYICYRCR